MTLDDLCADKGTCEPVSNYLDHKVKPILNQNQSYYVDHNIKTIFNGDQNFRESKSIFDNVETLGANLQNLKITDETVAKVMPFRIFSLAIHPTESKLLVAAGDKWGSIGFWDVLDKNSETKGIQHIKVNTV